MGVNVKVRKKKVIDISFCFWIVWHFIFLTIQVVIFLELEQALKDFLDLEIYRALIKLLD